MNIPYTSFKKISSAFQKLSKYVTAVDVDISYSYDSKYQPLYSVSYQRPTFKSVLKMWGFSKHAKINVRGAVYTGKDKDFWVKCANPFNALKAISSKTAQTFKTLKLVPDELAPDYRPMVIMESPVETTEGDYTYRVIADESGHAHCLRLIARNDEPIYDYLDKGFYIMRIVNQKKNGESFDSFVVANEYDVNTAHIFMMCNIQPTLTEMLRDGCFINVYEAEMLRLRMQKKMSEPNRKRYNQVSATIDNDYKKNTTLLVVGKLMTGDVEKTTVNNIVFTINSATYDRVSIEAEGLLDVLYSSLNFNSEFDIYTVVDIYSKHTEKLLVKDVVDKPEEKAYEVTVRLNEHDAQLEDDEEEKEAPASRKELATFKINGIAITPAISNTGQRYINKARINKEEIALAIHRASCHHSSDDYKLFLKSISRMSIKWHDIVANGLAVKIHSSITNAEYNDSVPGPSAPALKFYVDKLEKCIKLVVDKDKSVRVSLGRVVKRVETMNKRTDNGWMRRMVWPARFNNRNYEWAQSELINILVDATTSTVKSVDAEGKATETKEALLTKEDIVKLLSVANEAKQAAIERSKEFLNTAIKLTKAEMIDFMGSKAYKVSGGLRTYAVVIKNAKVYDFETKQYRCIVNDRHYAGAGYDDIAARLLALKNDSVMQDRIGTLRGAAQPAAENVHNDYRPERENIEVIGELVDKVMAAATTPN